MAGDWIKFELATIDKPEVWAIASDLNLDPDAVIGKLLRVWRWFDLQSRDGHAPSVTKKLLDRDVCVTGFCDSMISVGWMRESGEAITLPNFERHNGKSAKTRALATKRKQSERSRTERDTSVTREEKRREERPQTPRKRGTSIQDFLAECKESGIKAIPPDDPVMAYAGKAGIPTDFLLLAWREFVARHSQDGAKKYKDWRAAFRNCVRGNWYKLWWSDDAGGMRLTTAGVQARAAHGEAA